MLFEWFLGLSINAAVWDTTAFTKIRERLLAGDIAPAFFVALLVDSAVKPLPSSEHLGGRHTAGVVSVDEELAAERSQRRAARPGDPDASPARRVIPDQRTVIASRTAAAAA